METFMIRLFAVLMILTTLGACGAAVQPSEAYYSRSEVMSLAPVERCRVLETRNVLIGAQSNNSDAGFLGMDGQAEEYIGGTAGGLLGAYIGSQMGDGYEAQIASAMIGSVGAAGGQYVGSRMAQRRQTKPGVEYSILMADGTEQVIAQHVNRGDRIVPAGQTCRIVSGNDGLRVMPGEHLPRYVAQPATTSFR
jgi:outer membrane lipoprotein SlyB